MQRRPKPSPTDATHEDNWHGGFYELSIKLGAADDGRLNTALLALWQAAALPKPFRQNSDDEVEVSVQSLLAGHLHSVAAVPRLGSTLCTVLVVREEMYDSGNTRYGADWLDLCLPLGALANLDERIGAYPFSEEAESRSWREPIERWFATVASAVFQAVPFVHAVTGNEVSGVEALDVEEGLFGVFRPSADGNLNIEPIRTWSW